MGVSHVRRLRLSDRIFFLSVNLRPKIKHFTHSEFPLLIDVLAASRRRSKFLLCGYVFMPDPWHALVWPGYPLLISDVLALDKATVAACVIPSTLCAFLKDTPAEKPTVRRALTVATRLPTSPGTVTGITDFARRSS